MLIELGSSNFFETPIFFKSGLNVVLGDNIATNSIGKSSLLLLIDFAFGGSDFLKIDNGALSILGHQEYNFCFEFDSTKYYFKRDTQKPEIVYECNKQYEPLNNTPLDTFISFLAKSYNIRLHRASFRKFIGLFSRVWGKKIWMQPSHSILSRLKTCLYA